MSRLLLRFYPPSWRARYGEELEALILEASGGGRVPWRIRVDVAFAGCRERLRASGLTGDGVPVGDRSRAGSLLVLSAWVVFVVAGLGVQKLSEHWQDATPAADRGLPADAFHTLVVCAAIGSALVLAGIAAAIPGLVAFLRAGGWSGIRRAVGRAALVTGIAASATSGLVVWAHRLSSTQRAGHDVAYALGAGVCALLIVGCLVAWTAAAVTTVRQIHLSLPVLTFQAWLSAAVVATMATMTFETALWWGALAHAAPWFLAGRPVGAAASPLAPQLLVATGAMLLATTLGVAGAVRALRPLLKPALDGRR